MAESESGGRMKRGQLNYIEKDTFGFFDGIRAAFPKEKFEKRAFAGNPVIVVGLVGLTWAFFQHSFSGLRHFVMDIGAGFELGANKRMSIATIVAALAATAALWAWLLLGGRA